MYCQDMGVYRLTAVQDRRVVMTQDTAALCNMSLSSGAVSPTTATPTPQDCQVQCVEDCRILTEK